MRALTMDELRFVSGGWDMTDPLYGNEGTAGDLSVAGNSTSRPATSTGGPSGGGGKSAPSKPAPAFGPNREVKPSEVLGAGAAITTAGAVVVGILAVAAAPEVAAGLTAAAALGGLVSAGMALGAAVGNLTGR